MNSEGVGMSRVPEEARLERIMQRMEEAGGIDCADLREGDRLNIVVADGQRIYIEVLDPTKGKICVSSLGPWCIWLHLTDDWGMVLSETGGCQKAHRMSAGFRLYLGVWETPAITSIILNDFDLISPGPPLIN